MWAMKMEMLTMVALKSMMGRSETKSCIRVVVLGMSMAADGDEFVADVLVGLDDGQHAENPGDDGGGDFANPADDGDDGSAC